MWHKAASALIIITLLGFFQFEKAEAADIKKERYFAETSELSKKMRDELNNNGFEVLNTFSAGTHTFAVMMGKPENLKALQSLPYIQHAEYDQEASPAALQTTPWGIKASGANKLLKKSCKCKIAVIDSGVSNHEDLKGRVVSKVSFLADNVYERQANDDSSTQHGTHVAGIIAANSNRFGVVGMDPGASLLVAKVGDEDGNIYGSDMAKGISWAISNKVSVINLSLEMKDRSVPFSRVLKAAYDSGIAVIAAAGNDGESLKSIASSPYTISVGAIDANGKMASWSNYDSTLDILAPGVSIISTVNTKGYGNMSGTSMAAPHVAGASGKLLTSYRGPENGQKVEWLRNQLKTHGDKIQVRSAQGTRIDVPVLNVYKSYYGLGQ
ncbi:S8 family serine peptidase [Bacillus lacus]|uniref:S8 family serine peptidase n=1 Tax=Metabacillus lacus TaxID=1983721 RepID=A0A7X2J324_9BACI|nr:S8 family serine peptidase [Metabacillus lacus]MRX73678.1 S8 family serine peptidase [Metabacillus lacus]